MSADQVHSHQLFKIKTISELTGFSPTLLRAWERRFGFLEPQRQPGGHRLYTQDDLRVLRRIKELLDKGHTVGEVAALGRPALLGLKPDNSAFQEAEIELAKELAPLDLVLHRSSRYRGEGLGVSLRELEPQELVTVYRLYEIVKRSHELWIYMDEECRNESLVVKRLSELLQQDTLSDMARLGANRPASRRPLVEAALADTRWGAMGPLLRELNHLPIAPSTDQVAALVMLARDHAKILRNAFIDVDSALRSADESAKAHGIRGMVAKLVGVCDNLEISLDWDGSVSSRCLETSTVDRVLYDFLRRVQATNPKRIWLWVGPINDQLTRWAFHFDQPGFAPHSSEDLSPLAVGHSVGLTPAAALAQGYLGAADGWAWFHWPIYEPPLDAVICECEL